MKIHPFVAIDFETANAKRGSACSVALVKYDDNGKEIDNFSTLLKPHESLNYFQDINIKIHKISPEDVYDAPEWGEIYPLVEKFVSGFPIVAHNMAFDGSVLQQLSEIYRLRQLPNQRLCTLRIAQHYLVEDLKKFKLKHVHGLLFPNQTFQHHVAFEDAKACGEIFVHFMQQYGFSTICSAVTPRR